MVAIGAGQIVGRGARDVSPGEVAALRPRSHVDFGVVVGVEDYPRFRSLRGAAGDAARFHTWLCAPEGGGVAPAHARLIQSDLQRGTPVQDEIDYTLIDILDQAHALGGARRLYFYFSGHGATNREQAGDVALLLARWSVSLARYALSADRYSSTLGEAGVFRELAVFLDCCRSATSATIGLPPMITWRASIAQFPTRRFVAYACEDQRPAYEVPDGPLWTGLFTGCLLRILEQSGGGVPAKALKDRLEREVRLEAQRRGLHQTAHVENGLDAESSFGNGGQLPVLELRFVARRGRVRLYDGCYTLIGEHDTANGPWRLSLPVGLYKLAGGGQPNAEVVDLDGDLTRVI